MKTVWTEWQNAMITIDILTMFLRVDQTMLWVHAKGQEG